MPLGGENLMCFQSSYLHSGMYSPKFLQKFVLESENIFPLAAIMKLELSHKHRKFYNFFSWKTVLFLVGFPARQANLHKLSVARSKIRVMLESSLKST